jgi:hypothetical protein
VKRFWDKVNKDGPLLPGMNSQCWVWTAYCNKARMGYGVMRFNGEATSAHRVSWEINVGPIPADDSFHGTRHVLHKCDNPKCVRPDHLFLGTTHDNAMDMCEKNRQHMGENTGGVVATKQQVKKIRALSSEMSQAELCREFGLAQGIVHCIVRKKTWKHID